MIDKITDIEVYFIRGYRYSHNARFFNFDFGDEYEMDPEILFYYI